MLCKSLTLSQSQIPHLEMISEGHVDSNFFPIKVTHVSPNSTLAKRNTLKVRSRLLHLLHCTLVLFSWYKLNQYNEVENLGNQVKETQTSSN